MKKTLQKGGQVLMTTARVLFFGSLTIMIALSLSGVPIVSMMSDKMNEHSFRWERTQLTAHHLFDKELTLEGLYREEQNVFLPGGYSPYSSLEEVCAGEGIDLPGNNEAGYYYLSGYGATLLEQPGTYSFEFRNGQLVEWTFVCAFVDETEEERMALGIEWAEQFTAAYGVPDQGNKPKGTYQPGDTLSWETKGASGFPSLLSLSFVQEELSGDVYLQVSISVPTEA